MKTKYKILVALTLLVVFGLGVAAGVLGERYAVHQKARRATAGRPHPPSPEAWAKELGLTEEQKAQIRDIFKKNEERMKAYRTESRARLNELRKMLWDETNTVLTPEQRKKNEEMFRRMEEQRKKDLERTPSRDRREGDPPPPDRERS
jgi:Spy/CpxP family protein refolding chaperone